MALWFDLRTESGAASDSFHGGAASSSFHGTTDDGWDRMSSQCHSHSLPSAASEAAASAPLPSEAHGTTDDGWDRMSSQCYSHSLPSAAFSAEAASSAPLPSEAPAARLQIAAPAMSSWMMAGHGLYTNEKAGDDELVESQHSDASQPSAASRHAQSLPNAFQESGSDYRVFDQTGVEHAAFKSSAQSDCAGYRVQQLVDTDQWVRGPRTFAVASLAEDRGHAATWSLNEALLHGAEKSKNRKIENRKGETLFPKLGRRGGHPQAE
jgi:hypothetical protein